MMKVTLTVTSDGDDDNKVASEITSSAMYGDWASWMQVMEDLRKTLQAAYGYEFDDADTK
jgi:hypothetical protein